MTRRTLGTLVVLGACAALAWFGLRREGTPVPSSDDDVAPAGPAQSPPSAARRAVPAVASDAAVVPVGDAVLEGVVRSGCVPVVANVAVQRLGGVEASGPGAESDGSDAEASLDIAWVTAPALWSSRASAEGRFRVAALPPGRYRLTATLADRRCASRIVALTGASLTADIDVPLGQFTLSGRAIQADGSPFAGWIGLMPDRGAEASAWTRTGEGGAFAFAGIVPSRVRLEAVVPRTSFTRSAAVELPCGDFVFRVADAGRERAGRVTSARDGAPIAGASVRVWTLAAEDDPYEVRLTRSGADGAFRVRVPRGGMTGVAADGFGSAQREDDGRSDAMEFVLSPCGSVTGRVVDRAGGAPVAGVEVHAAYLDWRQPDRGESHTTSGPDGTYRLDGVGPGDVWLYARGAGWCSVGLTHLTAGGAPYRVRVPPEGTTSFDLEVEAMGRAVVRVVDESGAPMAGVRVFVRGHPWAHATDVEGRTGADGRAELTGFVPDSPYYASARADGRAEVEMSLDVHSGVTTELTITLAKGRFATVRVLDAETQAPIAGAEVLGGGGADERYGPAKPRWTTGADGVVRAGPIAASVDSVTVSAPGRVTTHAPFVPPPPEAEKDPDDQFAALFGERVPEIPEPPAGDVSITVALPRGGVVAGRVVFPPGTAPRPVVVSVHAKAGTEPKSAQDLLRRRRGKWEFSEPDGDFSDLRTTDESGRFRFDTVPRGMCQVSARTQGDEHPFEAAPVAVTTDGPDVDVTLADTTQGSAATMMSVRVVDERDADVAHAWVTLSEENGASMRPAVAGRAWFPRPSPGDVVWVVVTQPVRAGEGTASLGGRAVDLPGDAGPEFVVRLGPERVLGGRVMGPGGAGVPGARVSLAPRREGDGSGFRAWDAGEAVTGDDGSFRIGRLGDMEYLVSVEVPPGYLPAEQTRVRAGGQELKIPLEASASVRVTVLDDSGRPIAGCRVAAEDGERASDRSEATTGTDGVAPLADLDPGRPMTLHVTLARDDDRFFPVERKDWTPADTTLSLERTFAVTGVVRGSTGRPMPTAYVERRHSDAWHNTGVGADGSFAVQGLHRGETVELAAKVLPVWDEEHDAQIDPEPAWTTAVAGGEPVVLVVPAGPFLIVCAGPGRSLGGDVAVLLDGRVVRSLSNWLREDLSVLHFAGLNLSRAYTVWVPPDRKGDYALLTELRPDDEARVVTLVRGERLSGRVTARGEVSSRELPGLQAERNGLVTWCRVAKDLTFEFPGLPPGVWHLKVGDPAKPGEWSGEADARTGDDVVLTVRRN